MIHVCVPVLRRYDMLHSLVASVPPGVMLHVIDNGRCADRLAKALEGRPADVHTPKVPMGVAASWNWFIENVPEDRVIANDDVTFMPDSLQRIVETDGDFVSPLLGQAYSCFLLRDSCVGKIGVFDEAISPGYAYFEDCDYSERMMAHGFRITHLECGVTHAKSQTLAACSAAERNEHHRRFHIAQANFVAKWGRMPEGMVAS